MKIKSATIEQIHDSDAFIQLNTHKPRNIIEK